MSVTITGLAELQRELDKMQPGPLKRTLQKGTNAGGKFLKPKVQAAAPRRTGRLRKSISSTQAKRDRPATIVKARPKIAYYRHMVIGGTKPHRIRFPDQKAAGVPKSHGNIEHPGSKANPFITRTAEQFDDAAIKVAITTMTKELP